MCLEIKIFSNVIILDLQTQKYLFYLTIPVSKCYM